MLESSQLCSRRGFRDSVAPPKVFVARPLLQVPSIYTKIHSFFVPILAGPSPSPPHLELISLFILFRSEPLKI